MVKVQRLFAKTNLKIQVYRTESKGAVKKEESPKKERPRVYNELKVFLSVIINLQ